MNKMSTEKPYEIDENHVRLAGTNTVYPCHSQPNPDFYDGLTEKSLRNISDVLDSLPRQEDPARIPSYSSEQKLPACPHH